MATLHDALPLLRGPATPNRIWLAPLTNWQSQEDGSLGEDEFQWLTLRAQGGFGLTMTCAATVQANGRGFPGQLGAHDDAHIPGLTRLAAGIRAAGSVSSLQIQHSGRRAPAALIGGTPRCPWDDAETGAVALSTAEVEALIEDSIRAAERADLAGFDGVEIHCAHGYLFCQFLDPKNQRNDGWGGGFAQRIRLPLAILDGIRARTRPDFQVGLRFSPERYGMGLEESRRFAEIVLETGKLDYLDISMWSMFKAPMEAEFSARKLLAWFTDLPRHGAALGAAGKIGTAADAQRALDEGLDFVMIGRAAILHHDWPRRARDPGFVSAALPVSRDYLVAEGVGPAFLDYLSTQWENFVKK